MILDECDAEDLQVAIGGRHLLEGVEGELRAETGPQADGEVACVHRVACRVSGDSEEMLEECP